MHKRCKKNTFPAWKATANQGTAQREPRSAEMRSQEGSGSGETGFIFPLCCSPKGVTLQQLWKSLFHVPSAPWKQPGAEPSLGSSRDTMFAAVPSVTAWPPPGDKGLTKARHLKFQPEPGGEETQESSLADPCSRMRQGRRAHPKLTPNRDHQSPQPSLQQLLRAPWGCHGSLHEPGTVCLCKSDLFIPGTHNSPGQSQPVASNFRRSLKTHLC